MSFFFPIESVITTPSGVRVRSKEHSLKTKLGIINQALDFWNGATLSSEERKRQRVKGRRVDISNVTLKPKIEESLLKVKRFKKSNLFELIAQYFEDIKVIN